MDAHEPLLPASRLVVAIRLDERDLVLNIFQWLMEVEAMITDAWQRQN